MFENERDYAAAVNGLIPVLDDLPGKIVAIGGLPGVGKTTLARYLAFRFNVSLIETDLFLIRRRGTMVYRNDWIDQIISARLEKPRPVIIEGAVVLRVLSELGRSPDFIIHVRNDDAPESSGTLAAELKRYEAEYTPSTKADLTLQFDGI